MFGSVATSEAGLGLFWGKCCIFPARNIPKNSTYPGSPPKKCSIPKWILLRFQCAFLALSGILSCVNLVFVIDVEDNRTCNFYGIRNFFSPSSAPHAIRGRLAHPSIALLGRNSSTTWSHRVAATAPATPRGWSTTTMNRQMLAVVVHHFRRGSVEAAPHLPGLRGGAWQTSGGTLRRKNSRKWPKHLW